MANGNPLQDTDPNYPKGTKINQKYKSPKPKSKVDKLNSIMFGPILDDLITTTPKSGIDTSPNSGKPARSGAANSINSKLAKPTPKGGIKESVPNPPAKEQQLMIKQEGKTPKPLHPINEKMETTYKDKFQNPRHDLIEGNKNL